MIPINLIRQYSFCPRIVYYNLLTNIKPIFPRQVSLGSEYHQLQNKMLTHRRFKKLHINYQEIINETYLENEKLNICGIVDLAFITQDEIIPVEFKNINSKPNYSHILQLVGYGLLLKSKFNKEFKKAFIIYSKNMKFYKIDISTKHINDFTKTLKECEKIEKNNIFPNSSANENKCIQCEYLNFCDDRF